MSNIENYIALIEKALPGFVPELEGELKDIPAMLTYSLDGGGKRIRPLLCLEFCECAGGDIKKAVPFACAVEFVHTYSLIHDDLPCMDNDDYRRGKLSSHKKFGEANALLAGDALLTHAFTVISEAALNGIVDAEASVKAAKELSTLCGAKGMIGGQYIDLAYENKKASAEVLFSMDALKTAALIEAACVTGLIAAGADEDKIAAAREFALSLGLAFQIKDDILEEEEEGISSDVANGKSTYVSVYGMEKAALLAAEYTAKASAALDIFGEKAEEIRKITEMLLNRKK